MAVANHKICRTNKISVAATLGFWVLIFDVVVLWSSNRVVVVSTRDTKVWPLICCKRVPSTIIVNGIDACILKNYLDQIEPHIMKYLWKLKRKMEVSSFETSTRVFHIDWSLNNGNRLLTTETETRSSKHTLNYWYWNAVNAPYYWHI